MNRRPLAALVASLAILAGAPLAAIANVDPVVPYEAYAPDARGVPTVDWARIGFDKAAQEKFPSTSCPVVVGLLRMWVHASDSQRSSAEYRKTFQDINQELLRSSCILFP